MRRSDWDNMLPKTLAEWAIIVVALTALLLMVGSATMLATYFDFS